MKQSNYIRRRIELVGISRFNVTSCRLSYTTPKRRQNARQKDRVNETNEKPRFGHVRRKRRYRKTKVRWKRFAVTYNTRKLIVSSSLHPVVDVRPDFRYFFLVWCSAQIRFRSISRATRRRRRRRRRRGEEHNVKAFRIHILCM